MAHLDRLTELQHGRRMLSIERELANVFFKMNSEHAATWAKLHKKSPWTHLCGCDPWQYHVDHPSPEAGAGLESVYVLKAFQSLPEATARSLVSVS